MVLADGTSITATKDNEHRDLFLALQTGCSRRISSLGVVVSLTLRAHRVKYAVSGMALNLALTLSTANAIVTNWATWIVEAPRSVSGACVLAGSILAYNIRFTSHFPTTNFASFHPLSCLLHSVSHNPMSHSADPFHFVASSPVAVTSHFLPTECASFHPLTVSCCALLLITSCRIPLIRFTSWRPRLSPSLLTS